MSLITSPSLSSSRMPVSVASAAAFPICQASHSETSVITASSAFLESVSSVERRLFSFHYHSLMKYGCNSAANVTVTLPSPALSRPLAYSTLADLVHHVRQNLPLTDLSLAVQLFAKNIDDESLPSNIQTMSCKLLLNLVDCIRSKSEQENGNGRDILMRMLEVGSTELGSIQKAVVRI